jgi:signal transduction histidine kinase
MEHAEALKLLSAKTADDRLRAARCLNRLGIESDIPALETALAIETHRWVKSALRKALTSLRGEPGPVAVEEAPDNEDQRMIEQIYAEAVEETTHRLVHEISPVLGRLNVCAASEIPNYEESETKAEWCRLQQLLGAINILSQAASAPVYADFNLVEILEQTVSSETAGKYIKVQLAGPKPFVLFGASNLIQLVITNAVRNSIEAVDSVKSPEPVIINWDKTDKDYWIAILDRGKGPPPNTHKIYEIGTTTKRGHLGMGLALAKQAARSLGGKIFLAPRKEGGARFELRWPQEAL